MKETLQTKFGPITRFVDHNLPAATQAYQRQFMIDLYEEAEAVKRGLKKRRRRRRPMEEGSVRYG
jgi:hypothetical protein